MNVCAAAKQKQRKAATTAVCKLVDTLKKHSNNSAKIDPFMTQLLQNSSDVFEVELLLKLGVNADIVYDANAAFIPNVLRIHPETKEITLDTKFIADAVRQYLTEIEPARRSEVDATRRWYRFW